MNIFLSGQVQTKWRDKIIKLFPQYNFYNPKVKKYSRKHKEAEKKVLKESDFVIILLKGRGKGTTREWMWCKRVKKPHKIFKSVVDIGVFLLGEQDE